MSDCIRETIIKRHLRILEAIREIKTVVRKQPSYSNLQQFAVTQFPLVACVAGLPVPKEKLSGRSMPEIDIIISTLRIEDFVYIQDNSNPDATVSKVCNALWRACYSDPTYDGIALKTIVNVDEIVEYWEPFTAFRIISIIDYKHNTEGI